MSARMERIARQQARKAAEVVSHDEQITRQRVDNLEAGFVKLTDYAEQTELLAQRTANVQARSLLGRLNWLFRGR